MSLQDQLGPEWYELLGPLFSEPWMVDLGRAIGGVNERADGMLCPSLEDIFKAYRYVQPSQLRVLILGQDPYPRGQADGFAFSTKDALPPKTLRIVFDEMEQEGFGRRHNPNLTDWASQGVMLLNTILTCTYGVTLSHRGWGWEKFIGVTLDVIDKIDHPFVVMAWGTHAKDLIKGHIGMARGDRLYLQSIHPVAESYSNGYYKFSGCNHFSKANEFLEANGMDAVQWNDPTLQVRNQEAITQSN